MEKKLPASMRTRQSLSELIEGRLSTPDCRSELVKLATRLIIEEALEAESRDVLGREYYEHGAAPGQGYRNGVRTGRLKTSEGLIDYSVPQITGCDERFRSAIREHLKGRTEALETLAVVCTHSSRSIEVEAVGGATVLVGIVGSIAQSQHTLSGARP